MAEKLISPGVFTRERDLTFLPQGIAQISGAFVGPTERGPAFEPVLIESPNEYREIFGNGGYYTDYAVVNYLKDANSAYVVRILGKEGYRGDAIELIYDASSPNAHPDIDEDMTLAVLVPTQNAGGDITNAYIKPSGGSNSVVDFDLELEINDGADIKQYKISFDTTANNYITKVFGNSPKGIREVFVFLNFYELHEQLADYEFDNSGGQEARVEYLAEHIDFDGARKQYSHASTPWVQSQDLLEDQPDQTEKYDLFRFHTLSHGDAANRLIKVGIERIRFAGTVPGTDYGTFSVVVRAFDDTDSRPTILEQFDNLNLDPTSPRYVKRVIGNRYTEFRPSDGKIIYHGDYPNNSKYIRVEVDSDVERANDKGRNDLSQVVPWGFGNYKLPVDFEAEAPHGLKTRAYQSETDPDYDVFPGPLAPAELPSPPDDERIFYGFDFNWKANLNFLNPIGENIDTQSDFPLMNLDFSLSDVFTFGEYSEIANPTGSLLSQRKFIMGLQGGFDGMDPSTPVLKGEDIQAGNTQGFDCSTYDAAGSQLYDDALGILANDDEWDINLVVTPGIIQSLHPFVVKRAIEVCEERRDCFYVFDSTPVTDMPGQAVRAVQTLDSNYAGTYYPWCRVLDYNTNQYVEVPPSVLMPRVYAFNDKVSAPWYAPAGLNRGGIPEAVEAVTRLTKAERDTLYDGRVNPIAQFPREGVVAWGQKTLQARASALDRINVRRLLIAVKKFIASASRYLVFEQNVAATRLRFLNIVNPYLEQVQQRAGLYAFRVKMDEENNTPDLIDRNILYGELYLQPARAAEFIVLDFNILPTGATFPV